MLAILKAIGWLPTSVSDFEACDGEDILPRLVQAWAEAPSPTGGSGQVVVDGLRRALETGSQLTVGLPGRVSGQSREWLGSRLVLWPRGVPGGLGVGLVSSRVGRRWDRRREWFGAIRTCCARLDSQERFLITTQGSTTDRFVRRCADHFSLRLTQFVLPHPRDSFRSWARAIANNPSLKPSRPLATSSFRWPASISPSWTDSCQSSGCDLWGTPLRDRTMLLASDRIFALAVRRGGNIERLLRVRLTDRAFPPASVFVAIGAGLVRQRAARPLLATGAIGWLLARDDESPIGSDERENAGACHSLGPVSHVSSAGRMDVPRAPQAQPAARLLGVEASRETWSYLTHCTRGFTGPWPEQAEDDFLDDLIWERHADRSPLASLIRILSRRRLIASSRAIRGGWEVVSFTAVPLARLARLRVFRAHRRRWDFEPYGIAIRAEWLRRIGARPVIYGEEPCWNSLREADRPFFQRSQTRGTNTRDWTVEQEWRILGSVTLDLFPPEAGFVFVPDEDAARSVLPFSQWPVVVLGT